MFKQVNRLSLIAGDLRGARVLGSLFNVHVEERIFFDEIDCLRVAHDSPGPSALGKWDHRKSLCPWRPYGRCRAPVDALAAFSVEARRFSFSQSKDPEAA